MAEQLSFPLPRKTSYAPEDFYPGLASAVAREMLADPGAWPRGKLILLGPERSGKTHLLRIWAEQQGGAMMAVNALSARARTPIAIDNASDVAGNREAETRLFHLHNNLAAAGLPLLLAARHPPQRWGIGLPDLASRLEAAATATIEPPDDGTLRAILLKLMADRQLNPAPNLAAYIEKRMARTYLEAERIVSRLDALSLSERREITTKLAGRILDDTATPIDTSASYPLGRKDE
ncbi:MAG: DnaA/Hda family protein [Pseudomonadota bacterium]